jgi:hypothetical protein
MRRLSLNRSEPAKKSGQNIPKNRCRTTIAERMVETRAELPFIGDQVVCLSHNPRDPDHAAVLVDTALYRVRAGTLDDTSWLRPTKHFWVRSKQPWIMLPEGDQAFATQPE